jgi:hypothetical protein
MDSPRVACRGIAPRVIRHRPTVQPFWGAAVFWMKIQQIESTNVLATFEAL